MNATARSREVRATRRRLTLADVCRAIAEGELPARQEGRWYAVRKRDVAQYALRLWPQATWLGRTP